MLLRNTFLRIILHGKYILRNYENDYFLKGNYFHFLSKLVRHSCMTPSLWSADATLYGRRNVTPTLRILKMQLYMVGRMPIYMVGEMLEDFENVNDVHVYGYMVMQI